MEMIQTEKLVYEYEKRDEEGNVIGTSRAIDEVDIEAKEGQFIAIFLSGSFPSVVFLRVICVGNLHTAIRRI